MRTFEVSKEEVYKVKNPYSGDEYSLRYPTTGDLDCLQADQKEYGEEAFRPMINLFINLGMPEEAVRSFKPEWLAEMMNDLSSKKK